MEEIQNTSQTSLDIDTANPTTNKDEINKLREEIRQLKLETTQIYSNLTPDSTPSSSRNNSNGQNSFRHNSIQMFMKRRNNFKNKYNSSKFKYESKIKIIANCIVIKNKVIREFLAELIGTFIFLTIALASIAEYVFGRNINFLSVAVSFGFALTTAIVVCGKVSGGHFNPAVSFAFLILGKLTPIRFLLYVIAQNVGAFVASIMVYLAYLGEFQDHPKGMHSLQTSVVFGTLPRNVTASGTETFTLFFDQFIATTMFVITILAVCDENNTSARIPHTIKAIFIGFSLMLVGTSYGINCGFAVNPARDFGPRMFTLIFGWGPQVFEAGNNFFWIPVVAPMVGAVFAVIIYYVGIGAHLNQDEDEDEDEN